MCARPKRPALVQRTRSLRCGVGGRARQEILARIAVGTSPTAVTMTVVLGHVVVVIGKVWLIT